MRSVQNIAKITSAMKMVAASKMRVAQTQTEKSRGMLTPFLTMLGDLPGMSSRSRLAALWRENCCTCLKWATALHHGSAEVIICVPMQLWRLSTIWWSQSPQTRVSAVVSTVQCPNMPVEPWQPLREVRLPQLLHLPLHPWSPSDMCQSTQNPALPCHVEHLA